MTENPPPPRNAYVLLAEPPVFSPTPKTEMTGYHPRPHEPTTESAEEGRERLPGLRIGPRWPCRHPPTGCLRAAVVRGPR